MRRKKKPVIELPKGVFRVRVRGRDYYYFQANRNTEREGKRIRIKADPDQPEFWKIVRQLAGLPEPKMKTGTFKALIKDYKESPEYHALSPRTAKEYDRHITTILDAWSELKVTGLKSRHVLQMRDGLKHTPTKANHVIGVLSAVIAWGIPRDYAEINPCRDVPKFKKGEGYSPWSWEAIDHFRQNATSAMWHAAALALYTGQRQGDCLEMKWSDIRDGVIAVTQGKTGKEVWVPLHKDLQKVLDQIERHSIFILTNSKGQPWKGGFQSSWQKQLKKPG